MGLNVRGAVCLFVAALGLSSFDAVAAKHHGGRRGGGLKRHSGCGDWERLVRIGRWYKCVKCGGHNNRKWSIVCQGRNKCRDGYKKKGRWCVKIKKACGKKDEECCKRRSWKPRCRGRLSCEDGKCVRPSCKNEGDKCCRGRHCKGGLKCVGGGRGTCEKRKKCGGPYRRCCRPWWGHRSCKRGLSCYHGLCYPKHRRFGKYGKRGGKGKGRNMKDDDGKDDDKKGDRKDKDGDNNNDGHNNDGDNKNDGHDNDGHNKDGRKDKDGDNKDGRKDKDGDNKNGRKSRNREMNKNRKEKDAY